MPERGARAAFDSVQAWRMLRTPFVLPARSRGAHACEWERIDVDRSGCRLCSHVHACGYGVCTAVVETSDALVCEITGLCVRPNNISSTGFSDEVISYGCKTAYSGDVARLDLYDDIDGFVHELLLSPAARALCALERSHHAAKLWQSVQRASARADMPTAVDMVQHALRSNTDTKSYALFDAEARARTAEVVCRQLRTTIPICNRSRALAALLFYAILLITAIRTPAIQICQVKISPEISYRWNANSGDF